MDLFSLSAKIVLNDGGINSKLEGINSKAKGLGSGFDGVFDKIKNGAIKIAGLLGMGLGIKELATKSYALAESASDLVEAQNVVDSTFGKSAAAVEKWTDTTAKSAGISKTASMQYSGFMGAMLKSSGIGASSAATMSEKLVQLTGDMSSFYNIGTSDMWEKIRSGISGETMPLKQIGINMDAANLSAFALAEGIKKPYKNMSQAEQTQLRYNYLLSVTKDAQGDFAKTLGTSFANQVRVAQLNLQTLGAAVGTQLLPYFMKGTTWLNSNLPKIQTDVTNTVQRVIGAMQKLAPIAEGIIKDAETIVKNLLPVGKASDDTGSRVMALAKGGLTDLKSIFDWLASHGALVKNSLMIAAGGMMAFKSVSVVVGGVSKVKKAIDGVASTVNGVKKFAGGVVSAGKTIKSGFETMQIAGLLAGDKLKGVGSAIGTVASKLGGGTLTGLKTFGSALKTVGSGALDAAKNLGSLVVSLAKSAAGFAASTAKVIAHGIALAAHKAATLASAAAEKIAAAAQWLLNAAMNASPLVWVVIAIAAVVAAIVILWNKNAAFRDFVIAMWGAIQSFLIGVWNGIQAVFSVVAGFFQGVFAAGASAVRAAWSGITGFFNGIRSGIMGAFAAIGGWFASVFNAGAGAVRGAWSGITGFFSGIVSGIRGAFSGVGGAIQGAFSGAIGFIQGLPGRFLGWGHDMINGLVSGIRSGIDAVGNAAKSIASKISSFLHFSVPDDGPLADFDKTPSDMIDTITGIADGSALQKVGAAAQKVAGTLSGRLSGGLNAAVKTPQLAFAGASGQASDSVPSLPGITVIFKGNYFGSEEIADKNVKKISNAFALSIARLKG